MELLEAIKRNLDSASTRGDAMLANAQRRRSLMKKAGFQLYERQLSDSAREPGENDDWAALTWGVISQNAQKQSFPKGVLIEPAETSWMHIVAESTLAWFADRGGAVLVDVDLFVLLHPRWHQVCNDEKIAAKIVLSAHRLAALMIASAVKEKFHLVISMPTDSFADWQPVADLLDQTQYQSHGILRQPSPSSQAAQSTSLRQQLRMHTNMIVVGLTNDHATEQGEDTTSAGNAIEVPRVSHAPVEQGTREIRLGAFTKQNAPQQLDPQQCFDVERRKAMQENIRRRAGRM